MTDSPQGVSHRASLALSQGRGLSDGGSEVPLTSLEERINTATDAALARMLPRSKDADSAAWEAVIKRARDGAYHPIQPTGHTDATKKHPVCQQMLSTIGAGESGSDVRKALGGTPFGWPRDAVDAALIAHRRQQHITATPSCGHTDSYIALACG